MKKLSLEAALRSHKKAAIIKEEGGQEQPAVHMTLSDVFASYGLDGEDLRNVLRINDKLKESNKTFSSFAFALHKLLDSVGGSSGEWPQAQPQAADPFAEFEGEEEDTLAQEEHQQWTNLLNRRKQVENALVSRNIDPSQFSNKAFKAGAKTVAKRPMAMRRKNPNQESRNE